MYTIEQLQEMLKIDKNDLDEEIVRQPEIYYQVAQQCSEKQSQRDYAYDDIKRAYAEISLEVREDFEREGRKSTEALVEATVRADPGYIKAQEQHAKLRLEADKYAALQEAFSQRAYMLRELVKLYVSGYFMDSSVNAGKFDHDEHKAGDIRKRAAEQRKGQDRNRRKLEDV